jgi:hypothetical protein
MLGRLISLQANTIDTIQRLVQKGSDSQASKAACYVLDQADQIRIGATDARAIPKERYATEDLTSAFQLIDQSLDKQGYRARCEELGISPSDH